MMTFQKASDSSAGLSQTARHALDTYIINCQKKMIYSRWPIYSEVLHVPVRLLEKQIFDIKRDCTIKTFAVYINALATERMTDIAGEVYICII